VSIGPPRGLTLIEVVVAAAVLSVVVAAAAAVFAQGTHVEAASRRNDAARMLVSNEIERLRALPFWVEAESDSGPSPCLVGYVFPHAVMARNTKSCYYVGRSGGPQPVAAFVSRRIVGGLDLQTVAQFVVSSRDGWLPLSCSEIEGFCCDEASMPPCTTLLVTVSAGSLSTDVRLTLCEQHAAIIAAAAAASSPEMAVAAVGHGAGR
jgi:prepilin-type N-terminal cleavage/methylation domain-containing protein